ncbi:MAG TPA: carbohydrate ABC transporter permease [Chloroflexota bacterium]|nr:carbohydrate ABC transporter permease [Chloroflexota bacterium]
MYNKLPLPPRLDDPPRPKPDQHALEATANRAAPGGGAAQTGSGNGPATDRGDGSADSADGNRQRDRFSDPRPLLLPFFWLLSSSLKSPQEIYVFPPIWLPHPAQWGNYPEVVTELPFFLYTRNTLIITIPAMLGQVLTSSLAAYGFARLRFPGRDVAFGALLATLMLPYAVTLIPVYIMFKAFGWLGTYLPLIVPFWFGGGAFNVFLLRQFFLTIPDELEEAALLDGAGYLTIYWRIILPLSVPALIVVTIFSFLFHWNDFLAPLIYLNDFHTWTLAMGVVLLKNASIGRRDTTNLLMAMSTMMITPIIIIFFVAQRAFIQGIVLTGLKG